jgi:hypothetical protein
MQNMLRECTGGDRAAGSERHFMSFADLCLFLGVMFALGTLVAKVIEVARRK